MNWAIINGMLAQLKNLKASWITSGRFGKSRLEWTANKLLKGAGAGSDPTEIDVPSGMPEAIAGDYLEAKADTEHNVAETTYTKFKEIILGRAGTYRIKFDLHNSAAQPAYGQVYKNGAAVGTEQTDTTSAYVTKSEDIGGWSAGDLCQLYAKKVYPGTCYIRNFRVYSGNPIVTAMVQDD